MAKLRREHVMIAQEMIARDASIRDVAGKLGVDESTLRYRLKRPLDAPDGRRERETALDGWADVVTGVLQRFGDARVRAGSTTRCPARVVFDVLVREFAFPGSYQAVRRHLHRTYGAAPVQAIRRVETPAGVQAQHDWFEWEGVVAAERCTLYGLIGTLSFSRATFVWVSRSMTQLAWQTGHLALFQRYGGVPLWVRHDNLKTAVARGAGRDLRGRSATVPAVRRRDADRRVHHAARGDRSDPRSPPPRPGLGARAAEDAAEEAAASAAPGTADS